VLQLLEKETLTKDEVKAIFAPVVKRPPRANLTGNGKRPPSDRPPVLTPAELATMTPDELNQLARGRRTPASPARRPATVRREAQPPPRPAREPRRRPGTDPAR
jgi:cell division protease FtsH